MFSTATATPVRSSTPGSSSTSQRRNALCHRYGGWTTTTGMPASAAASTERSILPIGSVPQTFLVSSRHGAWSAPTVEPELVGERADPARVLALRILRHHDLHAARSRTRPPSGRSTTAASRRRRPRRRARAGKPSHRCYRLPGVRPCVSCRLMWVFPLAAAVVALAFAAALGRRFARSRRLHLAMWCAALVMYAIASLAVAGGALAGWSRSLFEVYWILGGGVERAAARGRRGPPAPARRRSSTSRSGSSSPSCSPTRSR